MSEPGWLQQAFFRAAQAAVVRDHGGRFGLRDPQALRATIERPRDKYRRGVTDVFPLAAGYGFALVRQQPFAAGNKRLALAAMFSFLQINGHQMTAGEAETAAVLRRIEEGDMLEGELGDWLAAHSRAGT